MLKNNTLGRFWATAAVLAVSLAGAAGVGADPLQEALERLQDPEILVADAAVEEIVAFGARAVPALFPLLEDERRDVRAGAIRGLGLLGDSRAAEPLRSLLEESLARETPDDMSSRYHRILLVQAMGRLRDEGAAALLLQVAGSPDPFERAHAAISLFLTGVDPGYDLLLTCLEDADPAIRCLALEGAGESREDAVAELLLTRTRDDSWLVRDTAYRVLAPHAAQAAVREAYQRGASDPSWYVRRTVAEFARD